MNNSFLEKLLNAEAPTAIEHLSTCAEEQAKEWLCRSPEATFPPADFASWRGAAYRLAVESFAGRVEPIELQQQWESAFDFTIREVTGIENPSITRAEILIDIWSPAGMNTPAGYLARKGDIVNVQPAPFVQFPVTVMPRRGTIFCTTPEKVRELETVSLAGFIEPFPEHQE